jgi:hypothetical protein
VSSGYPAATGIILRGPRVSIDEQHVALPKLYGAPAYARPAPVVATTPRPFDPDDLPIEAQQTDDERELAKALPARAWAAGGASVAGAESSTGGSGQSVSLTPRGFNLRGIAGKLLGGD